MKTLAPARYVSAPPSAGEWKLDTQGRTRPRGALDSEGAAQCLDAVFQPDEPRTPDRVSPADPVVTDAEPEGTLHRLHLDIYDRSVRVLGRIGERLRDHVVGRDLDPFRQPRLSPHVELDGNPPSPMDDRNGSKASVITAGPTITRTHASSRRARDR
jgi:hypothetical protein